MTPEEAVQLALSRLDECSIPYMITGSFANNMHGVPRATYDAYVVIDVDQQSLDKLLESLGEEFYLSPEGAREALARERMFNIIHLETGFKVDLIIKKNEHSTRKSSPGARKQTIWVNRDGSPRLRTLSSPNSNGPNLETPNDSTSMRSTWQRSRERGWTEPIS